MTVDIRIGDCLDVLTTMPEASIDSVVTDPPYHLTSIVKRFGSDTAAPAKSNGATGVYARSSAGFMGQTWDGGDVAFRPKTWVAVYRVLKPGAHLLAFGGTRTYHRMVCAIEDAGFEIRDQIGWAYGSGFPKSLDVSKAIDSRKDWAALAAFQGAVKAARTALGISQSEAARRIGLIGEGETLGGGGFMWFETGMRLPNADQYAALKRELAMSEECDGAFQAAEREVVGQYRASAGGQNMRAGIGGQGTALPPGEITAPGSDLARAWQGWGTALKPAWEPICVARKPLIGTVAANVLAHGTGALNIDGCWVETTDLGRWPANLVHDGSDEVLACFPETKSGTLSPARFFYCAKASRSERGGGNDHPTVKPVALMRWLVRLVTPPGGRVLDPFAGSGTTGVAASIEQFDATLIEMDPKYAGIARSRIEAEGGLFGRVAAE